MRQITVLTTLLALAAALMSAGCRRSPEEQQAQFLESGKRHLANKDYARAILQFKNAARVTPKAPEPQYQLALAYLEAGSLFEGVAALTKATELDPNHAGAQVKLAELLARSGYTTLVEEGEQRLKGVLDASPEDAQALNTLALAESKLGRTGDAERHFREAMRKAPDNLNSVIGLAQMKMEQKDLAGAEEVLKSAVAGAPESVDMRLRLAEFYLRAGRLGAAEKEFREALKLDSKNARALLGLASVKVAAGEKEEAAEFYRQVSELPDRRLRHLYGTYLMQMGEHEAAVEEFLKQVKEDPSDRDARNRLVAAYLGVGRKPDAERMLAEALEENPKDVDALLLRSRIRLDEGRYGEAEENLVEALRYKPESAEAHYLMAKVHQARGEALLRQQELAEALKRKWDHYEARIELAQILIATNSARAALDVLDQAPESQKRTLGFAVQRNWALLALNDREELAKGIAEGLAQGRAPSLLIQDGILKAMKKDYAGARRSLEEALKENPQNFGALEAMLGTYGDQNEVDAGFGWLRQHAARWPKLARLQQYAGEKLMAAGKREEARSAFLAAREADPNLSAADLQLARLDLLAGNLDEARQRLEGIVSSKEDFTARFLLANIEGKAGHPEAAIGHLRQALALDPDNTVVLNDLAYLLADAARNPDEALKYAQQAQELAPDDADVEGTLGWVYYHKGLFPTAVTHLEEAVKKDGDASTRNAAVRKCHLAMAYFKAGNQQGARRMLQAAVKIDPNLPEAEEARALLREPMAAAVTSGH